MRNQFLEFDDETEQLTRDLVVSHQAEVALFERSWIFQNSERISGSPDPLSIIDLEVRERLIRDWVDLNSDYASARNRVAQRHQNELRQLSDRRKKDRAVRFPTSSYVEDRTNQRRARSGAQVSPRFRHLDPTSSSRTTTASRQLPTPRKIVPHQRAPESAVTRQSTTGTKPQTPHSTPRTQPQRGRGPRFAKTTVRAPKVKEAPGNPVKSERIANTGKKDVVNPAAGERRNTRPEYEYEYDSEESVDERVPINMLDDVPIEGMQDPVPTVSLDSSGSYSYRSYSSSYSSG
jgi:hypothetical protein